MASPIFISNPPPGFSAIAILRGIQLALLGAFRSLQNPTLLKSTYYTQALTAIKYSIAVQLLLWSPIVCLRIFANFISFFITSSVIESSASTLKFLQFNVLNLSVFVFSASRHFSKHLDALFLLSLQFIDSVYHEKHPDRPSHKFHQNLVALSVKSQESSPATFPSISNLKRRYMSSQDFSLFVKRHTYKAFYNLSMFIISKIPYVGAVILGLISFQSLNDKIGTGRAVFIFSTFQLLPKSTSVYLITTYYGSRDMVHDLLSPYFSRVRFTSREKEQWIKAREGVLFGFGLCFFCLIHYLPWIGLLVYGIAESSAAYLITKISDPPPEQASQLVHWNTTQLVWSKEKEQDIVHGTFVSVNEGFIPIPGSFIFS